jgi:hypothetical protein
MAKVEGFEESLGKCAKCGFDVYPSSRAPGVSGLVHDGCENGPGEEVLGF